MKKMFYKIVSLGCIINTVVMTLLYVMSRLMNEGNLVPKFSAAMLILLVSFALSAAEATLKTKLGFGVKITVHFAICLAAFLTVFFGVGSPEKRGSFILIALVFFVVIYSAVNVARFVLMSRKEAKKSEKEEYTALFKK